MIMMVDLLTAPARHHHHSRSTSTSTTTRSDGSYFSLAVMFHTSIEQDYYQHKIILTMLPIVIVSVRAVQEQAPSGNSTVSG